MHTGQMKDSDGGFGPWELAVAACRKCAKHKVEVRVWDSHCGGYTDMQFKCTACGHTWWVEGPDA
jgi:hypothetical protein